MILTRMGRRQEVALLGEVGRGVYQLEPFSPADVAEAVAVIERFPELEVGWPTLPLSCWRTATGPATCSRSTSAISGS